MYNEDITHLASSVEDLALSNEQLTITLSDEEGMMLRTLAHRLQTTAEAILEAFVADLVHSERSGGGQEQTQAARWLDQRTEHFAPCDNHTSPPNLVEQLLATPDDLDEALLNWVEVVYNEWEHRTELTFEDVGGIWRVWYDGDQWVIGPPTGDPIPAASGRLRSVLHRTVEMMRQRSDGAL